MSTKTVVAYRKIKRLIQEGHLNGGDRLTEARAAELVGATRGPVRESLRRLEEEGLLRSEGERKGRVVAYMEDQEPADMLYRYEFREAIEGTAARLAAKNMTGWQIDQLRSLASRVTDSWKAEDRKVRYDASCHFHHYLLMNCGNPLLFEAWQSYRLAPMEPRSALLDDRILAEVDKHGSQATSYSAVVEAIAAHDPDQAELLMKKRVRAVTEAIRAVVMEQTLGLNDKT